MFPNDLALDRRLFAKRYEMIGNSIDGSRLKIKKLKLYQDDKLVEED